MLLLVLPLCRIPAWRLRSGSAACSWAACLVRVSLKTLIDTGRGDLLSGEMGLAGQSDLSTKQKMLIQVSGGR